MGIENWKRKGYKSYMEYTRAERNFNPFLFGSWQKKYAKMLDDIFGIADKIVLDVGCAGGSHMKAMRLLGADVYGCDVEDCYKKTPFKSVRDKIHIIDTRDVGSEFKDYQFDFIHSCQVFEHFPDQQYSLTVLQQLYKLLKPGGIIYVSLVCGQHVPADEMLYRTDDDITHVNVWPKSWWQKIMQQIGFINVEEKFLPELQQHKFYCKYNWDVLICERE